MRKIFVIISLLIAVILSVAFTNNNDRAESLRKIYSRSPDQWPKPFVDAGVEWKELGILPESPLYSQTDSLKNVIELGKILFFDPRLSGSGKISCATCHKPELNWTDGVEKSFGHDSTVNKRNSPTIQNSWFYKKLFWDGRARDLEDQAFAPINSESEMHGDIRELPFKLRRIKGYAPLFDSAYGNPRIDPDRIAYAIATFEKTIVSRKSRFDDFLSGKTKALNNSELKGLHLFRTKARCMNCHHGAMFTDNSFHNSGFFYNEEGLYKVTHKEEDKGKFKTPSLRDVARTGPWMHDGSMKNLQQIISRYSIAKFPPGTADPLIKSLGLTGKEKKDLLAFLKAISAPPLEFKKPVLPE
jgi:cytochrome c peroxidase